MPRSKSPHLKSIEQRHKETCHRDRSRSPKKAQGRDWECKKCFFFNYEWRMTCYRCRENRPFSHIVEPEKAPKQLNPGFILDAWKKELEKAEKQDYEQPQVAFEYSKDTQMDYE